MLSTRKREYEYFNFGLNGGLSKKKTATEYIVTFLCDNGKTYYYNFSDGRKASTFYAGKEIWGQEGYHGEPRRFEMWWWTKEKFSEVVKLHIARTEERIKSETEALAYLKSI